MIGTHAFFSFTALRDQSLHRAYNEWHALDHRPENLALRGVAYGERWARTPDCAAAHAPGSTLDPLHYLNMYWFTEPVAAGVAEWAELAERSLQWGRRPDLAWADRLLMGFFLAVKGYAHPRVRVSPDVLPYRPNTGVHLVVTRVHEPATAAAEALFGQVDRVHIPAALALDGVAGAWTFASDPRVGTAAIEPLPAGLRVQLCYLDGDPRAVAAAIDTVTPTFPALADELYRGPLRSITPWQWDWFDNAPG